jgi:hypothetical protein
VSRFKDLRKAARFFYKQKLLASKKIARSFLLVYLIFAIFSRSAFETTQKLDRLIAIAPNIGSSSHPKRGINTPAASGIPIML